MALAFGKAHARKLVIVQHWVGATAIVAAWLWLAFSSIVSARPAAAPGATPTLAVPTVTGVSPSSGSTAGGETITLTGTGFSTALFVHGFGPPIPLPFFTIDSDTQITLPSPGGTGTINITVTNPDGTSAAGPANQFTFNVPQPAPDVTAISPTSGPQGGGTVVTITGTDLTPTVSVRFGSTDATNILQDSSTQLRVTAPAGTGQKFVIVRTASGPSQGTADNTFTYVAATPTVTAVNPSTGVANTATTVTLTGTNFASGATVTYGAGGTGTSPNVTFVNDTTLTVDLEADINPGTAVKFIVTSGGVLSAASSATFTGIGLPTVTAVSPGTVAANAEATITLTGTNFVSGATVTYGSAGSGTSATDISVVSATSLTAKVAANTIGVGTAVKFIVTVSNVSSAASSATLTGVALPTVTAISPATGAAGAAQVVTITGTNFGASAGEVTSVQFDGGPSLSGATWISLTQLTATAPASLTAGTAYRPTVTIQGVTSAVNSSVSYTPIAVPTVTAINPAGVIANAEATITLTGTNFVNGATVTYGAAGTGHLATDISVVSATSLTAKVAANTIGVGTAVKFIVAVSNVSSAASSATLTGREVPAVSSVMPTQAAAGSSPLVTLTGANFVNGAMSVTYGPNGTETNASAVTVVSSTSLAVQLGAISAGATKFVASVNGIPSPVSSATLTGIAVPTVTAVNPSSLEALTAGIVTLTGTNFVNGATTVTYGASGSGSTATPVTVVSGTTLTASVGTDIPANTAVTFIVSVNGVAGAVSTATVTGLNKPTVAGITPVTAAAGAATTVTIMGSNFQATGFPVTVSYGADGTGTPATDVVVVSGTSLTAKTGTNIGEGDVRKFIVTVGSVSSAVSTATLTGVAAPTVTGISPASGAVGTAHNVTITGTNFGSNTSEITSVQFDEGPSLSSPAWISTTQLTAQVPATGLTAGTPYHPTVTIRGVKSAVVSSVAFTPTASAVPQPTITGIRPASGAASTITLSGTNFATGATVTFGPDGTGASASNVVVTNDLLTANLPGNLSPGHKKFIVTVNGVASEPSAMTLEVPPVDTSTKAKPASATVGHAGVTVQLIVGRFVEGMTVALRDAQGNDRPSPGVTLVSPSQLNVILPADLPANTPYRFNVTGAGVSAVTSYIFSAVSASTKAVVRPQTFCYRRPPSNALVCAQQDASKPADGVATIEPGDILVVSGDNFAEPATCRFQFGSRMVTARTCDVIDEHTIESEVPSAPGTMSVASASKPMAGPAGELKFFIETLAGAVEAPLQGLALAGPPIVSNITPPTGAPAGGTVVAIQGWGFTGATAVSFGGVAATSFTVIGDTVVNATAPAHAAGTVDVIVTTPLGASAAGSGSQFTYAVSVPTMGEWIMLLLAGLLGGLGYLRLRRRALGPV
jgi:hypothetical protein